MMTGRKDVLKLNCLQSLPMISCHCKQQQKWSRIAMNTNIDELNML